MSGIVSYRGGIPESTHRVHVAVAERDGRLRASCGDPGRVTFLRSSAKPFQALPLVEDGVVDALGMSSAELAVCCASHNAEPPHLEAVQGLLARAGFDADDLECGAQAPLLERERRRLHGEGREPGRLHNNCSGKHAGMLALARHHGWEPEGYVRERHSVQTRMLEEVSRWTGVPEEEVGRGVDGCGVISFAVPLASGAAAFARFARAAAEGGNGARRVAGAMAAHPFLVAGTDRLDTVLMEATGGRIVAKVGAEGVFGAAVPERALGIVLKVEDGHRQAAETALVRVLDLLELLEAAEAEALERFRAPPITNTLGERTGEMRAHFLLEGA